MIELFFIVPIIAGIFLFFAHLRPLAYALGAIGFTSLALVQYTQGRMIGLLALIFAVGCLERLYALTRKK